MLAYYRVGYRLFRPSVPALSDRRTPDPGGGGRRQLRAGAVRLRHRGRDGRVSNPDSPGHRKFSGAGQTRRLADHAQQADVQLPGVSLIKLFFM
jgi:hypothetical protein